MVEYLEHRAPLTPKGEGSPQNS